MSLLDPAAAAELVARDAHKRAMAAWLETMDFRVWGTHTLRPEDWPDPSLESVACHTEGWLRSWKLDPWFYVVERGSAGGRFHAHSLFGGPRHLSRKALWHSWYRRFGRGRFEPLRKDTHDVTMYCAKYVVKSQLWWNVNAT